MCVSRCFDSDLNRTIIFVPTSPQVRQDNMACHDVLRFRYVIRPIGDHAEVSHTPRLSYISRLTQTQGVCRDREESSDRLLPIIYDFRTGCFRDGQFDLFCVSSWYDLPPCPLKKTSEANPNFESDSNSRPSFR